MIRHARRLRFFVTVLAAIQTSCQSATKTPSTPPDRDKVKPGQSVLQEMIDEEIIPALQSTRNSLAMLDSIKVEESTSTSLASVFYALEKAFKSAAIPKSGDDRTTSKDSKVHHHFEIPFVYGNASDLIIAKMAKDRDPKALIYDFFGVKSKNPDADLGMDVLFSRYNNTDGTANDSFWVFEPLKMNQFFKNLYSSDKTLIDPTLHIEFSIVKDDIDVFVWSDEMKNGVAGIRWDQFRATSNKNSPDKTKITFRVKCDKTPQSLDMVIDKQIISQGFRQVFIDAFKVKMGSTCAQN